VSQAGYGSAYIYGKDTREKYIYLSIFPNILEYRSSMKNSVDFVVSLGLFAATNFKVHTHLSKCWRGTWSEKGWEPPW